MRRRIFLHLLGLPTVLPVARLAERIRIRLKGRKPLWSISMDVAASAPFDLLIETPERILRRVVLPSGRGLVTVPMFCPRPKTASFQISGSQPVTFYGIQVELTAPCRTDAR